MAAETWTHHNISTNGIRLHYVSQGEGPLMLFLHGFPEFWYSWRYQIPEFASDHRVVAPDLRGYNDSDKPTAQSAYVMAELIKDVKGLITGLGYDRCVLVGHDWGGAIAWSFAYAYPQMVDRLIILNMPHPAKFGQGLLTPLQLIRSSYILLFQLPLLPEFAIQFNDFALLERSLQLLAVNKSAFTPADIEQYKTAFARPGALTAALNYYRNLFQQGIFPPQEWGVLDLPTLLLWGKNDLPLGLELSYGTEQYVRNLHIRYISNCGHWIQQEQHEWVNRAIRDFLTWQL